MKFILWLILCSTKTKQNIFVIEACWEREIYFAHWICQLHPRGGQTHMKTESILCMISFSFFYFLFVVCLLSWHLILFSYTHICTWRECRCQNMILWMWVKRNFCKLSVLVWTNEANFGISLEVSRSYQMLMLIWVVGMQSHY